MEIVKIDGHGYDNIEVKMAPNSRSSREGGEVSVFRSRCLAFWLVHGPVLPGNTTKLSALREEGGEDSNALLMLRSAIENLATARTSLQIVRTSANRAERAGRPISPRTDGFTHKPNTSGSRGRLHDVLSAPEPPVLNGQCVNRFGTEWEGKRFGPCAD